MNIRRKAAAVAGSAFLLSSLFAVVAAPTASALVSTASAGNVAAGATSAGTTVFSVTENSAAAFAAVPANPALLITITDSAGGNTVHFVGTPTLTALGNSALPAPGSLGATAVLQSAGALNNQLRINFAGSDITTIEKFDVIGLKVSADAGAATGGVIATVTGSQAAAVLSTTTTASGVLQPLPVVLVGTFAATFTITSVCPFSQSTGGGADPNASKLTFNDGVLSESLATTFVTGTVLPATGATQSAGFSTATVNGHAPGTAATQTVSNCSGVIGSPANVVNGAGQTATVTQVGNNPVVVNPGEQNQPVGTTTLTENGIGVVKAGSITFALSQPATGSVLFSTSPAVVTTTPGPIGVPVVTATANNGPGSCAAGTYTYEVTSRTGAGESTVSATAQATTTTAGSAVTIAWTAVAGATSYRVYGRPPTTAGPFGLIFTTGSGAVVSFLDTCTIAPGAIPPAVNGTDLPAPGGFAAVPSASGGTGGFGAGGTCTYRVSTLSNGNLGESATTTADIVVALPTSAASVALSWTGVTGATGYIVYRQATTGGGCAIGHFLLATPVTTFTDVSAAPTAGIYFTFLANATIPAPSNVTATAANATGTLPGAPTTYHYRVSAVNAGGQTAGSVDAFATLTSAGSITLTWPAIPGATSYNVYGRPPAAAGWLFIANTVGTSYTDTGAIVPVLPAPLGADSGTGGVAPTVGTVCNLSPDRKSCTVGVGAAGTVQPSTITLGAILLDVSADATVGTPVNVTITGSPVFVVIISSQTIAFIARVVVGIADQPTIFINYNDQITGTIKLTESAPGFFNAGVGGNNAVGLCLITGETFTRAPWIIVTTGDVKLNDGAGNPVSQIAGVLFTDGAGNSCVRWTIYSASTVASTIEIRGSDSAGAILPAGADSGPRLSVGPGLRPGTTQGVVLIGSQVNVLAGVFFPVNTSPAFSKLVSMATRAYKSGVSVSVVGNPPFMDLGSDPLAANISIKESLNGQLKAGDVIVVQILPRSTRLRSDVLMNTGSTNQLPIITTNAASGLLVGPVTFPGAPVVNCQPAVVTVSVCAFAFAITQQAFGPALGEITISNMDYIVAPDAALGPVQVNVFSIPFGNVGLGGGVLFNQVITNAIIGTAPLPPALTKTSASSAITKTQLASNFTVGTKVVHLGALAGNPNNIVTIRIKVDPSLVGKNVQIQRATKSSSGVWGAWSTLTSRTVGTDGFAYYYASAHSAQWQSYRGSFAGNAQWAASHSQTVQVRWL